MSKERKVFFNRRTALKTGGVAIASLFNVEVGKEDEPQFPKGVEIALGMYKKGSNDAEIYLYNIDDASHINISKNPSKDDFMFKWLPDGDHAVLASIPRRGDEPSTGPVLSIINIVTGESRKFAFGGRGFWSEVQATDSKIAVLTALPTATPTYSLYVVNYDGSGPEQVPMTKPVEKSIAITTSAGRETLAFRKYQLPEEGYFTMLLSSRGELIFPSTLPNSKQYVFSTERRVLRQDGKSVNVYNDIFSFKEGEQEATPVVRNFDHQIKRDAIGLTPDGNWIVFLGSKFSEVSKTDVYTVFRVLITGGKPQVILDSETVEADQFYYLQVRPKVEEKILPGERIRILFVPGLGSEVEGVGEGREKSNLFLEFQIQARKNGFTGADFMVATWNGYEIDSKSGLYYAKGHACEDTLSSHEERGEMLFNLILDWFKFHPNDELVVMTHSEGFHPAFYAMERLKIEIENNPNFNINPKKMKFIFTHAPALGLDKPGLDSLGELIGSACKQIGPLPSPGRLVEPAGAYLVEIWDNRAQKAKEIEEIVIWWKDRGALLASLGNWEDRVISIRLDLDVLESQIVPGLGDNNYMFDLGIEGSGHKRVWETQTGLNKLLELIGKQFTK